MVRCRLCSWAILIAAACCLVQPSAAVAQFDFLNSLLRGRSQPQSRFIGYPQLSQATQQAEKGDVKESLQSVRDAFKSGGAKEALGDQDALTISPMLVKLSKVWAQTDAPPDQVAEVLRDIVLPIKPAGDVLPYVGQWQFSYDSLLLSRPNARLPAPESVAAEMVRWTVLAKDGNALRERLKVALNADNPFSGDERSLDAIEFYGHTLLCHEKGLADHSPERIRACRIKTSRFPWNG